MENYSLIEKMLSRLGRHIGQRLALDGDGWKTTKIANFWLSFQYNSERHSLIIRVYGGDLKKTEDRAYVLAWAMRANHHWKGTAGAVFGLMGDELALTVDLDFESDFTSADKNNIDDFLIRYLPGLFGAAAATLEMCGEQGYSA
ncbi:MAG: type III secretion system chaperone [Deltaproteobacteria bacterium]|jgi:hypothetical protein|nr:type III secretion system chaperone [Deltaproteobacteria bacterium]